MFEMHGLRFSAHLYTQESLLDDRLDAADDSDTANVFFVKAIK